MPPTGPGSTPPASCCTPIRWPACGCAVVTHGGRESVCQTLYSALGMDVHSQLAAACGAALDPDAYVLVDAQHETRVPGLFSAGDVAKGLNQISVAIGGAAVAASAMHLRLLEGSG